MTGFVKIPPPTRRTVLGRISQAIAALGCQMIKGVLANILCWLGRIAWLSGVSGSWSRSLNGTTSRERTLFWLTGFEFQEARSPNVTVKLDRTRTVSMA